MKAATEKLSDLFELIIQAIGSCIFCIVFILSVFIMAAGTSCLLTENKPTAAAENQYASTAEDTSAVAEDLPTAIECGSCGAHVYKYWYWENINDGTPVKICRYCYENCIENTATEN